MSQSPPQMDKVCITDVDNKEYCFKPEEIQKLGMKPNRGRAKQIVILAITPQYFLPFLIILAIFGYVQYADLDMTIRFLGFSVLAYLMFLLFVSTGIVTFWFAFDFYVAMLSYVGIEASILTVVVFYIATGFGLVIHIMILSLLFASAHSTYAKRLAMHEISEEDY